MDFPITLSVEKVLVADVKLASVLVSWLVLIYPAVPRPTTVLWIEVPANCVIVWPLILLTVSPRVERLWKRPVPATSRVVAGAAVPTPTFDVVPWM